VRLALCILLLALPAQAAKKPRPSVWAPLVEDGRRFLLQPEPPGELDPSIVVEVHDVRTVRGAKVARLRWTVDDGQSRRPMSASLPAQIAVSKKGAYLLGDRAEEPEIARALAGKPSFADPPRVQRTDDAYVRKDGERFCIGVGRPPGEPCPAGVCHAEYCLAPGGGLVSISGNHTPDARRFVVASSLSELETGIEECDAMLALMYRCLPVFPEPSRSEMLTSLRDMARNYRQAVISMDARSQLAAVCRDIRPSITESMASLGCRP
jgi:hypothetical protein